jgi:hypothetical protein
MPEGGPVASPGPAPVAPLQYTPKRVQPPGYNKWKDASLLVRVQAPSVCAQASFDVARTGVCPHDTAGLNLRTCPHTCSRVCCAHSYVSPLRRSTLAVPLSLVAACRSMIRSVLCTRMAGWLQLTAR